METIEDNKNSAYVPGSLLPDYQPFEWNGFDCRDYILDEYYTGADADGLPNLDNYVKLIQTGVINVADLDKRIEMRGFREQLERLDVDKCMKLTEQGILITGAFLSADLEWCPAFPNEYPKLKKRETLMASVKAGDVLSVLIISDSGRTDVTFVDSKGNVLPFDPCHDYDELEFEKLKPLAEADWSLTCIVRDVTVYGGTCDTEDPEFHWRSCQPYVDIYGIPPTL